jgi:tRNA threonylcarbamoyladenosine biosynthesis protein TsaE
MKYISKNKQDTINYGRRFAQKLKGGEVIALFGGLGAGKTTFVQGVALEIGVKNRITSPTFIIMKLYGVPANQKIKKLCHIDAYRLNSADNLKDLGISDFLQKEDTVTIIEWPGKVTKTISGGRLIEINIEILPNDKRNIEFSQRLPFKIQPDKTRRSKNDQNIGKIKNEHSIQI